MGKIQIVLKWNFYTSNIRENIKIVISCLWIREARTQLPWRNKKLKSKSSSQVRSKCSKQLNRNLCWQPFPHINNICFESLQQSPASSFSKTCILVQLSKRLHLGSLSLTSKWKLERKQIKLKYSNLFKCWYPYPEKCAFIPLIWKYPSTNFISVFSKETWASWSNFCSITCCQLQTWNRTEWMDEFKHLLSLPPLVTLLNKRWFATFSALTAEAVNPIWTTIRQNALW